MKTMHLRLSLLALPAVLAACSPSSPTDAADPVNRVAALAQSRSCLGCHALDRKVVGPAFKDVAAKYAGDPTAEARLAAKIRNGGAGVWGPVPMPGNGQVSEAEATQLAAWVLSQK